MSLLPRTGVCFHCGHDHGNGMGSPRTLELICDHAQEIKWRDDLIAELRAKSGEQPADERKDAERFRFEHTNLHAMLEIELLALQGEPKSVDWWREQIDRALAEKGERDV